MKKLLIIVFVTSLLLGCVNPYQKYYFELPSAKATIQNRRAILLSEGEEPKIFRGSSDKTKDAQVMMENGYFPIGFSCFNASRIKKSDIISEAKNLRACAVVVYAKYTNTISGVAPLLWPTIQTSTTSLSGTILGSGGGGANLFGSGQTITYGTQVLSVPYNVTRYDFAAVYFIRVKPEVLGIIPKPLSPELRQKIGSNKGVLVFAVVKDSPAFRADILEGDIIKRIGDIEVTGDAKNSDEIIQKYAGKKVTILLIRDGNEITKEVQCNPRSY